MTIRTLPAPCWEIRDKRGYAPDPGTHFPDEQAAKDALEELEGERDDHQRQTDPYTVTALTTLCAIVDCNDCRDTVGDDEFAVVHYPDADFGLAADQAKESEWAVAGTDAWCEDCAVNPHDFLPDPGNADNCLRCPHPVEEHEPVASVTA